MFWQKKRVFASKNTTATCPRSRCAKTQTAAGYVTDVETLNHSPPRPPPPPPFLSSNNEGGEEEGGDCRAADHQCRDFTPLCALHYSAWRRAARQNSSATWRCFPAGEQAHCISEPTGRLQVLKWHERGSLKERGRETEKGGEGERERSQTSFGSEFSLRGMNSSTDINALKMHRNSTWCMPIMKWQSDIHLFFCCCWSGRFHYHSSILASFPLK